MVFSSLIQDDFFADAVFLDDPNFFAFDVVWAFEESLGVAALLDP
jgi:hypothetical protein